ncbi:MAG TPA: 6-pyruvoyl-tetrahydropterin synthase-related protein [Thermoanaerobaculaceae bacterium]|nr:6-pyruvoyl-tetrahydropterin synthase-related protein [Thermoanaerobaculaceae bacterium]
MRLDAAARRAAAAIAVAAAGLVLGAAPLALGPPGGDDAYYHAMYALEQARCWRGGVLLPTWYPDLNAGLGGPEPRARPQLSLAVQGALALVLDDAIAATSVATALIPVIAGLVMLRVARRRGAEPGRAVACGMIWSAAPYLLVTLHVRAALQEAVAVALLPWILDSLLPPAPESRRAMLCGGVALAVLLATQLLVAFMAGLVVAAAHVASRSRRVGGLAASAALGLGLAAWSWLPNVLGLRRLQEEVFSSGWFDWRRRFLFAPDDPAPALNREMAWVALALLAAAVVVLTERGRPRALAAGAILAVVMATSPARPLWALLPGFALLQFPWRWLGAASALVALAVASAERRRALAAGLLMVVPAVIALTSGPRLGPGAPLRPSDPPERSAVAATRFGVPPILPPFPAMLPHGVDLAAALAAAPGAREALPPPRQAGPRRWSWQVVRTATGPTVLPLLVDDAWRVSVDGRPVAWAPIHSLVGVQIPAGAHSLSAVQALLPEARAGLWTSAVAALAALWFWRRLRRPAGHRQEAPP